MSILNRVMRPRLRRAANVPDPDEGAGSNANHGIGADAQNLDPELDAMLSEPEDDSLDGSPVDAADAEAKALGFESEDELLAQFTYSNDPFPRINWREYRRWLAEAKAGNTPAYTTVPATQPDTEFTPVDLDQPIPNSEIIEITIDKLHTPSEQSRTNLSPNLSPTSIQIPRTGKHQEKASVVRHEETQLLKRPVS